MTNFLVRLFVPHGDDVKNPAVRQRYGILAGATGMACNVFLFLMKFIIGTITASVSITADAFNNLSDGLSSLVSVIGFRMAGKEADEEHPFGHGRTEYVAGLVVAFLILMVGVEFLQTSIDKILHPTETGFSWVLMGILAVSLLVKLWMGAFNRCLGRRIGSPVLIAAMKDSLNDVAVTSLVIVGMIAGQYIDLPVDGYVGVLLALFIVWSGISAAKDTLDPLLGEAADPDIAEKLRALVMQAPSVVGVHDLVIHNYGAGKMLASMHAEVPGNGDIFTMHEEIDLAERRVFKETGVTLVIHMDPILIGDPKTDHIHEAAAHVLHSIDEELQLHDLRVVDGKNRINVVFDMVVPFRYKKEELPALRQRVQQGLQKVDPRYQAVIQIDRPM